MTASHPDPALDAVATDLTLAIRQLLRRLRADANPSELSLSQQGVLSRLEQNGPMTTADLARAELMKPQSMGAIVASLEQEGLVERRPHPSDRRQTYFVLTEPGATLKAEHRAAKRDWLVTALREFGPAELKTLTAAIPLIRQIGEP